MTWANWYIHTKYYHRCVSACVYSKSHCGQVLKAHTCHNTLPTEGLGRQRLLPCGVISWLPYAKLTEISFWELRPYHHSSFFHSICTPRRVFALESPPHCDWVSLSLARLSARFLDLLGQKCCSTLCNCLHPCVSACTRLASFHARELCALTHSFLTTSVLMNPFPKPIVCSLCKMKPLHSC